MSLEDMTDDVKTESADSEIGQVSLHGVTLASLHLNGEERLCLAQISARLLSGHTYNDIHNRRVALGITCVQCTPRQLDSLRRVGAMPASAKRCGTITRREAERLVRSFLGEPERPQLPAGYRFNVGHACGWGCRGSFFPDRYTSSRARCVMCWQCREFFSPNKFIFHCHRPDDSNAATGAAVEFRQPDAANFNAWRRHLMLIDPEPSSELLHNWEDVKALFNGGSRLTNASMKSNSPALDQQGDFSAPSATSAAAAAATPAVATSYSSDSSSRGSSICGEAAYSASSEEPPAKIAPAAPVMSPLLWAQLLMLSGSAATQPLPMQQLAASWPQTPLPLPIMPLPVPLMPTSAMYFNCQPACQETAADTGNRRGQKRRLSDHSIEAIIGASRVGIGRTELQHPEF